MSYKFKGEKIILDGKEVYVIPGSLPPSPSHGYIAVDSVDNKFKVWSQTKSRWIVLGDAEDVRFNNFGNGFVSNTTQAAIEEARNKGVGASPLKYEQKATNLVSTTSSSFQSIAGMSITPPEGKYLVIFNGSTDTTGVNTEGEFALFIDNAVVSDSVRVFRNSANILGLVTLSTNNSGSGSSSITTVVLNGSQSVSARFRHISGGSLRIRERILTLVRVFEENDINTLIGNIEIPPNDHSQLINLLNDDHPQYLRADGSRALVGNLNLNNNSLINLNNINGVNFNSLVEIANTPTFSYRDIKKNIKIPIEQQMVVYQEFCVSSGYELTIEGEVVVL